MTLNRTKATDYYRRQLGASFTKFVQPEHLMMAVYAAQKQLGFTGQDLDGELGPVTVKALRAEVGDVTMPDKSKMIWPMISLPDGRKPVVTSGMSANPWGGPNKHRVGHPGVDILYRYLNGQDPPLKEGADREGNWWVPLSGTGSVAYAMSRSKVIMASHRPTGYRAWLEVGDNVFVGYFHLRSLYVKVGDELEQGVALGPIGDNPRDSGDPRHLHFEVHLGDLDNYPKGLVDPEEFLQGVKVL